MYQRMIQHDYLEGIRQAENLLIELDKDIGSVYTGGGTDIAHFKPGTKKISTYDFFASITKQWGGDDMGDYIHTAKMAFMNVTGNNGKPKMNYSMMLVASSDSFGKHIDDKISKILDDLQDKAPPKPEYVEHQI